MNRNRRHTTTRPTTRRVPRLVRLVLAGSLLAGGALAVDAVVTPAETTMTDATLFWPIGGDGSPVADLPVPALPGDRD